MPLFARPSFEIIEFDASGEVRLELHGELDLATVRELVAAIRAAERRRPARLVVDVAKLTFIDARGFRVLLDAARRAEREERRFVLSNPSPQVTRILQITGGDRVVDVARRSRASKA